MSYLQFHQVVTLGGPLHPQPTLGSPDVQEIAWRYKDIRYPHTFPSHTLIDISPTSPTAPLRSSERRRIRVRTAERFHLAPEIAEQLVPDVFLSQKFTAYNSEPGVGSSFRCPRRWGAPPMVADSSELRTVGPLPLGRRRSALVQCWERFG